VPDPDAPLPQDVPSLHALVQELRVREARKEDRIQQLLQQVYGRKSERHRPPPGVSQMAKPHGRGGRHALPRHLPTRHYVVDLPASAKKGLKKISEEIREHLEYKPASLVRVVQVIPVYAHPKKLHGPRKAHIPPRVIPQAGVGPRLLAKLLVSKYADHLPLARQSTIFARDGVTLARQKLCHWVERCAQLLYHVYRQLVERVQRSRYIQADETPVRVRDRGTPGKTRQGYFWVYLAPEENAVVFDFHLSRHRQAVERFIPRRWGGTLQTDGYAAYGRVVESRPLISHCGCNYHARRKVYEAKEHGERQRAVLDTLEDYEALSALEERAKLLKPEAREALRGRECPPIFARIKARYEQALVEKPAKRRFRVAAHYALERWDELIRYAAPGFGHVKMGTNDVERLIRPVKVGLKNYLFLGSPEAGPHAATLYSLLGTCARLHVNPEAYLAWVLPRLAEGTNQSTAQGLLPHDYAAMLAGRKKH
jgi:transposase